MLLVFRDIMEPGTVLGANQDGNMKTVCKFILYPNDPYFSGQGGIYIF